MALGWSDTVLYLALAPLIHSLVLGTSTSPSFELNAMRVPGSEWSRVLFFRLYKAYQSGYRFLPLWLRACATFLIAFKVRFNQSQIPAAGFGRAIYLVTAANTLV